jgi:WD40 repeat protein
MLTAYGKEPAMPTYRMRTILAAIITLLVSSPPARAQAQEVTALVYTADAAVVISAHRDGTVRLRRWDREHEFLRLRAHKSGAFGLALSPDGDVLASSGADNVVRLWSIAKLRETLPGGNVEALRVLTHPTGNIVALAFAPDGHALATGDYDGWLRVWRAETGELTKTFEKRSRIISFAYAPDGKKIAVASHAGFDTPGIGGLSEDQWIEILDASTGKRLQQLPHRAHQLAFTPDGSSLISNGRYLTKKQTDQMLVLQPASDISAWDIRRGRAVFQHNIVQQCMALSRDGRLLATGWGSMLHVDSIGYQDDKSRGIQVREVASGKCILWRKVDRQDATALAFSPAGTHLAVGSTKGWVDVRELAPQDWQGWKFTRKQDDGWQKMWDLLASADAVFAHQAGWEFSQGGDDAIAFLKSRLRRATVDSKQVARLIAGLGSDEFEVRQASHQELRGLGSAVEPELWRALDVNLPLEVRRRVQAILDALPTFADLPEVMREYRAIAALERSGSPAARACLQWLAEGAAGARLTEDARAALDRLAKMNAACKQSF